MSQNMGITLRSRSLDEHVWGECKRVATELLPGGSRHGTPAAQLTDAERVALGVLAGSGWHITGWPRTITTLSPIGIIDGPDGRYHIAVGPKPRRQT